jgi:dienelactone hydrolase
MRERCRLDVYYPNGVKNFPTVVWFPGGGLKGGNRSVPKGLKEKGIAVVAVNYRLHPKVKSPAYIEDAAAAVAWTFRNIEKYGGSQKRIFVSGHSAGGYLTSMLGLDKRWLQAQKIDADDIAGLIPYSGHTITRFEENAYLWRMMQVVGHPNTEIFELEGFNHGQMAEPAHPLLLRFVKQTIAK